MTSDAILIAIIAATPGTIAGLASLVASLRNAKKIEQVHLATNSMKDELVAVTKKASKDEGVLQEKQDEQGRKDLIAATLASAVPDSPLDVKITNLPSEPVPTVATDAGSKPTEKLNP